MIRLILLDGVLFFILVACAVLFYQSRQAKKLQKLKELEKKKKK